MADPFGNGFDLIEFTGSGYDAKFKNYDRPRSESKPTRAHDAGGAWKSEGTTPCAVEIFILACPNRPEWRATAGATQLKLAFERSLLPYSGHVGRRFYCR